KKGRPQGEARRPRPGQVPCRCRAKRQPGAVAAVARPFRAAPPRVSAGLKGCATNEELMEPVRYQVKDRVAVITIDNPPVNALSPAVWEGIDQAVQRAVADPAADAIVLIGAGTTFIAGADIKVFDTLK